MSMARICRLIGRWQAIAVCVVFSGLLAINSYGQLLPPIITIPPLGETVQNGGTAVFSTTVVSLTTPTFTWLFDGQPISAGTDVSVVSLPLLGTSTLTISNVVPADAGKYSVRVNNGLTATSTSATLVVLTNPIPNVVTIVSAGMDTTAGGFKLQLSGPAGSNYVIQASTDLKNWIPIYTNAAPTGSVTCTDAAALNLPFRYYRAKIQ
ncbi:MAG: immunoglobulin domain-containing protein [Limisphaerales bacterium]